MALDQLGEFLAHFSQREAEFHPAEYWRLLLALPSVLGLAGVAVLGVYLWQWDAARLRTASLVAADAAFVRGDTARAWVAYRRAMLLPGPNEPLYRHRMALCQAALGQGEAAVKMLQELAPLDKPGYGPAHLLLAGEIMKFPVTPERARVAETHLRWALRLAPEDGSARAALGVLYFRLERWEEARNELKEAVGKTPELALMLARAERARGDESAARAWAERALKYFSSRLQRAAPEDVEARKGQAEALAFLGSFEAAVGLLTGELANAPGQAYKPVLGEVCAEWAACLEKENPDALAQRLEAITLGLSVAPANVSLLQALGRLSSLPGAGGEAARKLATQILATGTNAPILHFTLGNLAWQRGELAEARTHFEAAYAGAPNLPDLVNNLAAVLLIGPNPNPARALALVEPLVAKSPDNPYYRESRGQALLALGRPKEALTDLEFALPLLPDKLSTHRALAQVYAQLNLPDLAAEHARLAATNTAPAAGAVEGN